jgi:hypothetical protein
MGLNVTDDGYYGMKKFCGIMMFLGLMRVVERI